MKEGFRVHGAPPYRAAVLHGGPGAAGEVFSMARRLSAWRGVLEPFQAAVSIDGQVEELRSLLEERAEPPVALVGYSWGAWLALILASRRPALVSRLILVGCGPLEARWAEGIEATRLSRLSEEARQEVGSLRRLLADPAAPGRDAALARLGELFDPSDCLSPDWEGGAEVEVREDVHDKVWREAAELRRSGGLLELVRRVRCPVSAVHGDYDPHPAEGVREPLSRALPGSTFYLLRRCGHAPWVEREAKEEFFRILESLVEGET
ncbi:MAG: alpha/beta hydrolase [Elusimicrobia bacterium]|nr:alpha/beta hydrolase [Elusimicrobiota bacterium]